MKRNTDRIARVAAVVLLAIATGSCNDINKQSSPVQLVLTTAQNLHQLDLAPGALNCDQSLGTVNMQAITIQGQGSTLPSNPLGTTADLNQVKIDRYRVTYVRIDGGHAVPASFVRSISTTLTPNGSAQALTSFVAIDANALNQAPFAALQPQNGGRDPETGQKVITMDLILEVFGETLAGEHVSGSTRMTLDFCYSCGGCG